MKTNTTILILLMFVSCCIVSTYAGAPPSDDGTYNVDFEYISDGSAHATELTPAILKEMQGWSVMAPGTVIQFPDPSGRIWSGKFYQITSDGLGFVELPASGIRGYGDDCPFSAINKTVINKQIAISPLKSTRYSEFLIQKKTLGEL
jgi:hypothetical protein